MHDLVTINAKSLKERSAIVAGVLIALIFGWIAISMQFGNLLAEQTTPAAENAHEIGKLAVSLSPNDPQAHNLLGLTDDDEELTVEQLETAVKLAPNDHRWRVALGRAYEQIGSIEKGESQLR